VYDGLRVWADSSLYLSKPLLPPSILSTNQNHAITTSLTMTNSSPVTPSIFTYTIPPQVFLNHSLTPSQDAPLSGQLLIYNASLTPLLFSKHTPLCTLSFLTRHYKYNPKITSINNNNGDISSAPDTHTTTTTNPPQSNNKHTQTTYHNNYIHFLKQPPKQNLPKPANHHTHTS